MVENLFPSSKAPFHKIDCLQSTKMMDRANKVMPGGVNSPVRAWNAVGGNPLVVKKGEGSFIWTEDGRKLVDFCGSWGPLILGHAHPRVVEAVQKRIIDGLSFGATTKLEIEMAELLCESIASIEMVRLVSSGTEAVMTALRLARGYTERPYLLKFDGCYHGHSDSMLISGGSGLLTGGTAFSAGVPEEVAKYTLVAPYNDLHAVQSIIHSHKESVAAIIVEPVCGNMGLVQPKPGFLKGLREITHTCGALLIFDEVISGFRLAPTTYGDICGITPDLTCLGKIIGGGMPLGALGGSREIMNHLAPNGNVYQAGTLSGNPIAVTAGMETIKILLETLPYQRLEDMGRILEQKMVSPQKNPDTSFCFSRLGSMFSFFFTNPPVNDLREVKQSNTERYRSFFHHMLSEGYFLPPSPFETCFISTAHNRESLLTFAKAGEIFLNGSTAYSLT